MKIDDALLERFRQVEQLETENFVKLVEASGLDPARDFRNARLRGVDFSGSDLSDFNFDYADLRGALWLGALSEPMSYKHSLRGQGTENRRGDDFDQLTEICTSKVNWSERFFAFKIMVDNWGENLETLEVISRLLDAKQGVYIKLASFLYLCASYARDEKMKRFSIDMAKAGRSQINIYKLNTLRKGVRDYIKYFESRDFKGRYPGDIDKHSFSAICKKIFDIENFSVDNRFL